MAKELFSDPQMRTQYPFAVSVDTHDGSAPEYIHFDNKNGADFYASLFEQVSVKRYVALDASEPLASSDNGWREVSYFNL